MKMGTEKAFGTIAVDAMGGDLGPAEVVRAVRLSLEKLQDIEGIVLVGNERRLERLIKVGGINNDPRISIYPASEIIGMDEKPIQSLKQKKDSSLVRAVELVKEGKCQAVVSCGNTGSLTACGILKLRPMSGVERPALATVIPSKDHSFILIDAGANPTAKADHLVHNAILGNHYSKVVLDLKRPRIGLLSIGTEESKGNELTYETNQLLRKLDGPNLNYCGMIEGLQVFENSVDVIVCDGFTGNILLKTCEGLFDMIQNFLKEEINKDPIRLAGAILAQGAFKKVKKRLDPERHAGAPLLGLRGHVLKAHGASNSRYIMSAIRIASQIVHHDLISHALADIEWANQIIRPNEAKALVTS